jgi:hypothetical protein
MHVSLPGHDAKPVVFDLVNPAGPAWGDLSGRWKTGFYTKPTRLRLRNKIMEDK